MEAEQPIWVVLRDISWQKRTGLLVFESERATVNQFAIRGGKMLAPRTGSLETALRVLLVTKNASPEFVPLSSSCPPASQSRLVDIGTLLRAVSPPLPPTSWMKKALSGASLTYLSPVPKSWTALNTSVHLWLKTRRWPTTLEEILAQAPMSRHECWLFLAFLARIGVLEPSPVAIDEQSASPKQLNRQLAKLLHPDANPSSSRIEQVQLTNRLHEARRAIGLRSIEQP